MNFEWVDILLLIFVMVTVVVLVLYIAFRFPPHAWLKDLISITFNCIIVWIQVKFKANLVELTVVIGYAFVLLTMFFLIRSQFELGFIDFLINLISHLFLSDLVQKLMSTPCFVLCCGAVYLRNNFRTVMLLLESRFPRNHGRLPATNRDVVAPLLAIAVATDNVEAEASNTSRPSRGDGVEVTGNTSAFDTPEVADNVEGDGVEVTSNTSAFDTSEVADNDNMEGDGVEVTGNTSAFDTPEVEDNVEGDGVEFTSNTSAFDTPEVDTVAASGEDDVEVPQVNSAQQDRVSG